MHWTWAECEEQLDLYRLQALTRQWRRTPPLAEMVAAYLGVEPEEPTPTENTEESFSAFENLFAAAGGKVH